MIAINATHSSVPAPARRLSGTRDLASAWFDTAIEKLLAEQAARGGSVVELSEAFVQHRLRQLDRAWEARGYADPQTLPVDYVITMLDTIHRTIIVPWEAQSTRLQAIPWKQPAWRAEAKNLGNTGLFWWRTYLEPLLTRARQAKTAGVSNVSVILPPLSLPTTSWLSPLFATVRPSLRVTTRAVVEDILKAVTRAEKLLQAQTLTAYGTNPLDLSLVGIARNAVGVVGFATDRLGGWFNDKAAGVAASATKAAIDAATPAINDAIATVKARADELRKEATGDAQQLLAQLTQDTARIMADAQRKAEDATKRLEKGFRTMVYATVISAGVSVLGLILIARRQQSPR